MKSHHKHAMERSHEAHERVHKGHHLSHKKAVSMGHHSHGGHHGHGHHSHAEHPHHGHHGHPHMHHSDPIVGGESEREGHVMGHGNFANMPQEVMQKTYPKAHEFGPTVLDDTMDHVDRTNGMADSKAKRYMSNQH